MKTLIHGLALAATLAVGISAAAVFLLHRIYYISILLPLAAAALIAVAYAARLKRDGFGGWHAPDGGPNEKAETKKAWPKIFLVAALCLFILSAGLYYFAGVGASFN